MLIMNTGRLLHQKMHGGGAVSMLHFKIMSYVAERGPVSMKELAGFLGVTAPSTTAIVNRLVRDNELSRTASQGDRRSVAVALTPLGRKNLERARRAMVAKMGLLLNRLSSRDAAELINILKKILET